MHASHNIYMCACILHEMVLWLHVEMYARSCRLTVPVLEATKKHLYVNENLPSQCAQPNMHNCTCDVVEPLYLSLRAIM
jgi:hypothetical protein